MNFAFLLLMAVATYVVSDKVSYKDFHVFRMTLKTEDEVRFVKNLMEPCNGCTGWSALSSRPGYKSAVIIAPNYIKEFTNGMNKADIKFEKYIDDVQELIDNQVNGSGNEPDFGWTRYHNLKEIYSWMDSLVKKYANKVEIIIGGRTYEGRFIKGVKISSKKNNPGVFIECGMHSDEWIAPATGTYLIDQLLTSKDPSVRKLTESYDWYIFPSVNPDGYVYTHEADRFWRKSRSFQNSDCYGVDLNRNWGYMWNKGGASNNTCDLRFAGSTAFSEVETRTMSEYINSIKDNLFAYISFHSFQQLLMLPYAYTAEHLDNYNDTMSIAAKVIKSLAKRYGTEYRIGAVYDLIYVASGASLDWVKGTLKLPLVYVYELRDRGDYGLLLPPEQIIPNGEEILDSLVTMFDEAEKLGYSK